MTAADFRTVYPQFTAALFTDAQVTYWLAFAARQMDAERWGELYDDGIGLFAAHNLTLEAAAAKAADGSGGLDAAQGGVVSESKTIGGISKSETRGGNAATASVNAGHWNATVYGQRWWNLAQLVGAGGLHV